MTLHPATTGVLLKHLSRRNAQEGYDMLQQLLAANRKTWPVNQVHFLTVS